MELFKKAIIQQADTEGDHKEWFMHVQGNHWQQQGSSPVSFLTAASTGISHILTER